MSTVTLQNVPIFATGVWNGIKIGENELDQMVLSFEALKGVLTPPVKLGHDDKQEIAVQSGQPAVGWIGSVKRVGKKILATFTDVPTVVADVIKSKGYRFVSPEVLPSYKFNNQDYPWTLWGVALLGAEVPAIKTLGDLGAMFGVKPQAFSSMVMCFADDENGELMLQAGTADFGMDEAMQIGADMGVDFEVIDPEQFRKGLGVEMEHVDVVDGDRTALAKIVLAHLNEIPDYYDRLEKMEQDFEDEGAGAEEFAAVATKMLRKIVKGRHKMQAYAAPAVKPVVAQPPVAAQPSAAKAPHAATAVTAQPAPGDIPRGTIPPQPAPKDAAALSREAFTKSAAGDHQGAVDAHRQAAMAHQDAGDDMTAAAHGQMAQVHAAKIQKDKFAEEQLVAGQQQQQAQQQSTEAAKASALKATAATQLAAAEKNLANLIASATANAEAADAMANAGNMEQANLYRTMAQDAYDKAKQLGEVPSKEDAVDSALENLEADENKGGDGGFESEDDAEGGKAAKVQAQMEMDRIAADGVAKAKALGAAALPTQESAAVPAAVPAATVPKAPEISVTQPEPAPAAPADAQAGIKNIKQAMAILKEALFAKPADAASPGTDDHVKKGMEIVMAEGAPVASAAPPPKADAQPECVQLTPNIAIVKTDQPKATMAEAKPKLGSWSMSEKLKALRPILKLCSGGPGAAPAVPAPQKFEDAPAAPAAGGSTSSTSTAPGSSEFHQPGALPDFAVSEAFNKGDGDTKKRRAKRKLIMAAGKAMGFKMKAAKPVDAEAGESAAHEASETAAQEAAEEAGTAAPDAADKK